jgi:hypothetical protein
MARAGARVALLDKETFPRDKICGDAVCTPAIHILEASWLGLAGWRWQAVGRGWEALASICRLAVCAKLLGAAVSKGHACMGDEQELGHLPSPLPAPRASPLPALASPTDSICPLIALLLCRRWA